MENILNAFVFPALPLAAGILIFFGFFRGNNIITRRFTKYFSILYFIYAILLVLNYNTNFELQYMVQNNDRVFLGFDILGTLLSALIAFIILICVMVSKSTLHKKHRLYYSFLLFFESAFMFMLAAQDFYLFCGALFFEIFSAYVLIANFSDSKAHRTARNYLTLNIFCAIVLSISFALLSAVFLKNSLHPDMINLAESGYEVSHNIQAVLFFALLIISSAKLPLFPLHKPLSGVIENSCPHCCFIFLGEFILGFFIFVKFAMYALSGIFVSFAPAAAIWGIFNILYFGILALGQKELKKSFAYFCFSQTSVSLTALASLNTDGICASVLNCISLGLIFLGLFLCYAFAIQIFKTSKLPFMGGLAAHAPKLAALCFILTLAGANTPLTINFVSRFLCLLSGFSTQIYSQNTIWICTVFTLLGFILGMIYLIKVFQNIFFGINENNMQKTCDLLRHRWAALLLICIPVVFFGAAPQYLGTLLSKYADMIISMFLI